MLETLNIGSALSFVIGICTRSTAGSQLDSFHRIEMVYLCLFYLSVCSLLATLIIGVLISQVAGPRAKAGLKGVVGASGK